MPIPTIWFAYSKIEIVHEQKNINTEEIGEIYGIEAQGLIKIHSLGLQDLVS